MTEISEARRLCGLLIAGWVERVEHQVVIDGQTETRVEYTQMPGLLDQLEAHGSDGMQSDDRNSGGSNPNKGSSRPPGSLVHLDVISRLVGELKYAVFSSRQILGFGEKRQLPFADVQCPQCEGPLCADGEGTIGCTGCAYKYPKAEWLGLL